MSEPWNDAAANGARSPDSVIVYARLYEVLAGYSPPPRFKFSPPDEDERVSLQHRLIYLNWLASKPMVYTLQTWISYPPAFGKLYWPRSDFFSHACVVSLDLRADHSRLLGEITTYLFGNTYLAHDTIYGSVCNYDTVMALRIDNARSRSLDAWHVSFDLLPIHRRESGFVDINAVIPLLARLGQSHCSSPLIWRALSIFNQFDHRNDSDTMDVRSTMSTPTIPISLFSMPPELLALVVHHLDDRDLLNFALASHTTMLAVHRTARIRYPWIAGYRLVSIRPIQLTPDVGPDGQVKHPEEDIHTPYAAFVTESDEILLIGLNFSDLVPKSRFVRASVKGTLIVPYCPHALISVSFAVIAKNVLEYLEQDATREGLGRMMRRRQRLIISWTEQYAEWDDIFQ